jgi:hypothetical protein
MQQREDTSGVIRMFVRDEDTKKAVEFEVLFRKVSENAISSVDEDTTMLMGEQQLGRYG